jgi:hypothetical protein
MSYMNHVSDYDKNRTYSPKYPEKYVGKTNPIARSSWEEKFMNWCDMNPSVIKWSSEPVAINYYDPVKKKDRRYFPDFLLRIRDKNGKETNHLVEIKPYKETMPPLRTKNKTDRTLLHETTTYMTNVAKWKAAITHCKKIGLEFRILTERDLFVKGDR